MSKHSLFSIQGCTIRILADNFVIWHVGAKRFRAIPIMDQFDRCHFRLFVFDSIAEINAQITLLAYGSLHKMASPALVVRMGVRMSGMMFQLSHDWCLLVPQLSYEHKSEQLPSEGSHMKPTSF